MNSLTPTGRIYIKLGLPVTPTSEPHRLTSNFFAARKTQAYHSAMAGHGKRVFVTGVSGFVASHIVSGLIQVSKNPHHIVKLVRTDEQDDYTVVGSVRTEAKGREILKLHPSWRENLSFVYIADIAAEDAYEKIYSQGDEGFDYIIHTASPVTFQVQDVKKDLIDPAVRGYA